jgi:hypothetical protein
MDCEHRIGSPRTTNVVMGVADSLRATTLLSIIVGPFRLYTFRALAKTLGPLRVRRDVCRVRHAMVDNFMRTNLPVD